MRIAYLDESYDKAKFWLGALLCDERCIRSITGGLDQVIDDVHDSFGISREAELHGHRLFHGEEHWKGLQPRQRIWVYDNALKVIGDTDAAILLRGVALPGLKRRYHQPDPPHVVVLRHMIERLDEIAERDHFDVLAVADEVPEGREHQRDLWRYQRWATDGYRSRRITSVLDTIYFGPSDASRLLQAADLVTFLHRRIVSRKDTDTRAVAANELLWSRIGDNVVHSHCWFP